MTSRGSAGPQLQHLVSDIPGAARPVHALVALLVAREPALIERFYLRLCSVEDQRPPGQVVDSLPDRLEGYFEINRERPARDQAPVAIVDDDAPAQGPDRAGLQHAGQCLLLKSAEGLLAVRSEDFGDRHPGLVLDQVIQV